MSGMNLISGVSFSTCPYNVVNRLNGTDDGGGVPHLTNK